jgi:hypothetical protein
MLNCNYYSTHNHKILYIHLLLHPVGYIAFCVPVRVSVVIYIYIYIYIILSYNTKKHILLALEK